jgi:hypothetical protein
MGAFDDLLDKLHETAQRRGPQQPGPWRPSYLSRPPLLADTKLMKALDDIARLHQVTSASAALAERQRQVEKVEDIRQRARDLIKKTHDQLLTAVADGKMTAVEVSAGASFLDRFARKMGL